MIKLKNIVKDDNIISCDIFPEDSVSCGSLFYDIVENSVKSYELPAGYEWCKKHIVHAKNALREMVDSNQIQKEKLIMWI